MSNRPKPEDILCFQMLRDQTIRAHPGNMSEKAAAEACLTSIMSALAMTATRSAFRLITEYIFQAILLENGQHSYFFDKDDGETPGTVFNDAKFDAAVAERRVSLNLPALDFLVATGHRRVKLVMMIDDVLQADALFDENRERRKDAERDCLSDTFFETCLAQIQFLLTGMHFMPTVNTQDLPTSYSRPAE